MQVAVHAVLAPQSDSGAHIQSLPHAFVFQMSCFCCFCSLFDNFLIYKINWKLLKKQYWTKNRAYISCRSVSVKNMQVDPSVSVEFGQWKRNKEVIFFFQIWCHKMAFYFYRMDVNRQNEILCGTWKSFRCKEKDHINWFSVLSSVPFSCISKAPNHNISRLTVLYILP